MINTIMEYPILLPEEDSSDIGNPTEVILGE